MSYQFYKLLHLIGVIILFSGIGAVLATANGTTKNKLASIANGVGLLVIFVAGFGLMARLNTGFAPVHHCETFCVALARHFAGIDQETHTYRGSSMGESPSRSERAPLILADTSQVERARK